MHRWALQRICPDSQCLGCMPHPTYLRVAKLCGSQRDSYEGNLELRQPRSHCELAFLLLFSTLATATQVRSEEHTSELQSLMRISYAVFCLKKTTQNKNI